MDDQKHIAVKINELIGVSLTFWKNLKKMYMLEFTVSKNEDSDFLKT